MAGADSFALDDDAVSRAEAVYTAAKAVTGKEVPRTSGPQDPVPMRYLVRMVRALAMAAALCVDGQLDSGSNRMSALSKRLGTSRTAAYHSVEGMRDWLKGRPAERAKIEAILGALERLDIKVSLPLDWSEALDYRW